MYACSGKTVSFPAPGVSWVSNEAITALHHVALNLPALKYLHLYKSAILPQDIQDFSTALVAFSPSITHLALDTTWRSDYCSTVPDSYRNLLFAAIAHFSRVKGLYFWNWRNLVGGYGASSAQYKKSCLVVPCESNRGRKRQSSLFYGLLLRACGRIFFPFHPESDFGYRSRCRGNS